MTPRDSIPLVELSNLDALMANRRSFAVEDMVDRKGFFHPVETANGTSDPIIKLLTVPLVAKDQLVGVLGLVARELDDYNDKVVELIQVFANQAAISIDNMRLRQQVQQSAILEERDRLARELHDAVTQTIFSAALVAEAIPNLWTKSPEVGQQYLDQLPGMLRGALAEMRTLLLELRPESLRSLQLDQLLDLLADAIRTRSGAIVTVNVDGELALSEEVTMALHRISQEALNNIVKHAEASRISIDLETSTERAILRLVDDGRGFELGTVRQGSLGLDIMHERADQIGAKLQIESKPGQGCMVTVQWPGETVAAS